MCKKMLMNIGIGSVVSCPSKPGHDVGAGPLDSSFVHFTNICPYFFISLAQFSALQLFLYTKLLKLSKKIYRTTLRKICTVTLFCYKWDVICL